jgi:hypothetical protein
MKRVPIPRLRHGVAHAPSGAGRAAVGRPACAGGRRCDRPQFGDWLSRGGSNTRPSVPDTDALVSAELRDKGWLIADVVMAPAAVEATRPQAARLETCVLRRRDTDRCARASRRAPCRRARRGRRGAPAFRKDNPHLRLRETSKARQIVEFVGFCHDTSPRVED